MSSLDTFRAALADIRKQRDGVREALAIAVDNLAAATTDDEKQAIRQQISDLRQQGDSLRSQETDGPSRNLDPRQWMGALDGRVPILLMPLRVQTRFDISPDGASILVRAYPDDISVQSHDHALTPAEALAGQSFWAAPTASDDPAIRTQREIFRGMATRYGIPRAAWIMRATDPAGIAPTVRGTLTRIPACWTLPERLVFRFFDGGGRLVVEIVGASIPDGLEMGFDPSREALGFVHTGDDFDYPPELAWQADFGEALKVGMGVALPSTDLHDQVSFSRIEVLGVRLSTNENVSTNLLATMIEDHRYSDGFSLLPQGTPTNITQDADVPPLPDADAALDWLQGAGAFGGDGLNTKYEDECDSLRLAHALGIPPATLRYVDHANLRDGAEAIAMKRTLWAGTFGYYAQQMLWPFFQEDLRRFHYPAEQYTLGARFFFTHFVSGRGPLPAIRVGSQPYGILPVSGDMLQADAGRIPAWGESFIDPFFDLIHGKLLSLSDTWRTLAQQVPRAGAGNNADSRLVDVLSLQASSAEFHAERLVGKNYLQDYADYKHSSVDWNAYLALLNTRWSTFAGKFPSFFPQRPFIFDLAFMGAYWNQITNDVKDHLNRGQSPLLTGDVVDDQPFSESRPIQDAYPNYLAQIAKLDFADVRRGIIRSKDGKDLPLTALLYLMTRHSYLYEYAFAAMRLHRHFQGKPWSAFQERELYNGLFVFDTTYWDIIESKAQWNNLGVGDAPQSALDLLQNREQFRQQVPYWSQLFGDVDELHRSLVTLSTLPTARLERLFAEHVDMASYRLDAWITGYTYSRLLAVRAWRDDQRAGRLHPMYEQPTEGQLLRYDLNHRPLDPYAQGIYLGAYGWVEDVRHDPPKKPVTELPPELRPRDESEVTRDADNYGLIHAPSLNQATTAALLRAGSVTEPDNSAFNINLSSARVRTALWIMEGVRNGQAPAVLLGYQFERGLRDVKLTLLQYLPYLRNAFPMPQPTDTATGPTEASMARNVVNGVRLAQSVRDSSLPAILAGIPAIAAGDRAAIEIVAAGVLDSLDACSDLMIAESVHQAALGNFDRAGGVVTAAGEFQHVPDEFEVVQTPRTGTSITHRLLLAFNADGVEPPAVTPRARLAPRLNTWLGALIGGLEGITCGMAYGFTAGGVALSAHYVVTLDGLGIEPIDLIYLIDDSSLGDLGARLQRLTQAAFAADQPGITPDRIDLEEFAVGAAGTRPLGELLPLLAQLRTLLGSARAATKRDWLPPNQLHDARTQNDIDGFEPAGLAAAVSDLVAGFQTVHDDLANAAALDIDTIAASLLEAAAYGVPYAVPAPAVPLVALQALAARVVTSMQARLTAALDKWTPPNPPASDTLRILSEVVGDIFGTVFPLLPPITLTADLGSAALPPSTLSAERVEDWLFVASTVRQDAAKLQHLRILAAETATPCPPMQVLQWPDDQKIWVAETGALDAGKVRDFVAIAVQPAGSFDPGLPLIGVVVDEWHELIPNETETTGIAFNYDAPNAEPPQTLLLAVSERQAQVNGNWTWDELVRSLEQSLALAKLRAVSPDELRKTDLDIVLPATIAAEAAAPATIATSFLANISEKIAFDVANLWRQL